MVKIAVIRLDKELPLPKYETVGAAGMDVYAAEDVTVYGSERKLVKTGLKVAIPVGYEIQVRPRSGLALKQGVTVLNTPGTIDSDYRGEIGVILMNTDSSRFVVKRGDRIAQLVVAPVVQGEWEEVDELPTTERGEGGFGSTNAGAR